MLTNTRNSLRSLDAQLYVPSYKVNFRRFEMPKHMLECFRLKLKTHMHATQMLCDKQIEHTHNDTENFVKQFSHA